VKKSVVKTIARSSSNLQTAASSGSAAQPKGRDIQKTGKFLRSVAEPAPSASALSLEAQPAHLERLVRRICFPKEKVPQFPWNNFIPFTILDKKEQSMTARTAIFLQILAY